MIVTRDGEKMYVYTRTDDAQREAERVVARGARRRRARGRGPAPALESAERFWQDADEPLAESDDATEPDYEGKARKEGVPHPLFVYIEGHEPEFLRDLGA